ncbi:hypothetical protein JCM10212_003987 [Sporobolomyces blumeae]
MAEVPVKDTLAQLTASLAALETSLDPLLASSFADLVQAQPDSLPKAKLEVLISYAVHDLIWVYLKTSGVEPSTHPVMQEIERLKGYFAKIKSAESGAAPPSTEGSSAISVAAAGSSRSNGRMQIDKGAASRFISAAIGGQGDAGVVPSGTHTRFDAEQGSEAEAGIEANEEVERLLEETVDEDDEMDEDTVDAVKEPREGSGESMASQQKGKGKSGTPNKKRNRIDPFAGYDQPKPSPVATPTSSKRKPRMTAMEVADATSASASDAGGSEAGTPGPPAKGKKSKNKKKKLSMK